MKFPAINKQGKRRVNIPQFTGGINLRDNPSQCNDNQLTELVNMWFKDGTLRTRPGTQEKKLGELPKKTAQDKPTTFKKIQSHNVYKDTENGRLRLCSLLLDVSGAGSIINCFWCGGDSCEELPPIESTTRIKSYFIIRKGDTIYCFSSNGEINKLKDDGTKWEEVSEEEKHSPLIMTHCTCNAKGEIRGTNYESFNLIGNSYRLIYSTYNRANSKTSEQIMSYALLDMDELGWKATKVIATLSRNNSEAEFHTEKHEVELDGNGDGTEEKFNKEDKLRMYVSYGKWISFENEESAEFETDGDAVEDNLEIKVYYEPGEEKSKIFNMTQAEWFGGASAGIAGGTRLFLCGNTANGNPEDRALVCWSGLNNPLYFPENSYYYVGDTSEKVTGFGKQSDSMIIFKEDETWYTRYAQNTNITAADLINQNVVDIQASAVYFPLVQINSNIGCPYPNTIQLCRNRLVWLGRGGNVYTLVSESQYNERNIFIVSDMIKSKLLKEDFDTAVSCDWEGLYCLGFGEHIYLMDYNSYGYQYVSSFSKKEDANLHIPWYYWELNEKYKYSPVLHTHKNDLCFIFPDEDEADSARKIMCRYINLASETTDAKKPIKNLFQTKFFDFGEANSYKNISSVGLSLGGDCKGYIPITFIIEGGEEEVGLFLGENSEGILAGNIKSRILTPAIGMALRFGIRIESEGNILIDGLTIDYRVTGRAR